MGIAEDQLHLALVVVESNDGIVFRAKTTEEGSQEVRTLSCFGGKVLEGEKPYETVARKLLEDAGVKFGDSIRSYLGGVVVDLDPPVGEFASAKAEVYHLNIGRTALKPDDVIGTVVVIPISDIDTVSGNLSPVARAIFKEVYI